FFGAADVQQLVLYLRRGGLEEPAPRGAAGPRLAMDVGVYVHQAVLDHRWVHLARPVAPAGRGAPDPFRCLGEAGEDFRGFLIGCLYREVDGGGPPLLDEDDAARLQHVDQAAEDLPPLWQVPEDEPGVDEIEGSGEGIGDDVVLENSQPWVLRHLARL